MITQALLVITTLVLLGVLTVVQTHLVLPQQPTAIVLAILLLVTRQEHKEVHRNAGLSTNWIAEIVPITVKVTSVLVPLKKAGRMSITTRQRVP